MLKMQSSKLNRLNFKHNGQFFYNIFECFSCINLFVLLFVCLFFFLCGLKLNCNQTGQFSLRILERFSCFSFFFFFVLRRSKKDTFVNLNGHVVTRTGPSGISEGHIVGQRSFVVCHNERLNLYQTIIAIRLPKYICARFVTAITCGMPSMQPNTSKSVSQ